MKNTMERLQNVTLKETYELTKSNSFVIWKVRGNYMDVEIPMGVNKIETIVFLGKSIFILGLSMEKDGNNVMASTTDFIDIWPYMQEKYPQLFNEGVKGEARLIP